MSEPPTTRTRRLRDRHGWSQREMADHLGVAQPTVARLEAGQAEPGPISRLLDLLEAQGVPRPAAAAPAAEEAAA